MLLLEAFNGTQVRPFQWRLLSLILVLIVPNFHYFCHALRIGPELWARREIFFEELLGGQTWLLLHVLNDIRSLHQF